MDSELLLKFIGFFPDYLSASSRTLLRSFLDNPLSKQLYTRVRVWTLGRSLTGSQPIFAAFSNTKILPFASARVKKSPDHYKAKNAKFRK